MRKLILDAGGGPPSSAASTDAAAGNAVQLDPARAAALLKEVPVRYSTPGAIDPTWLADITAAAGVSTGELVQALRRASAVGACGMAEWQEIMRFRR